eukprot:1156239-Pelagomonas_calceolata.AAC.4
MEVAWPVLICGLLTQAPESANISFPSTPLCSAEISFLHRHLRVLESAFHQCHFAVLKSASCTGT